MATSPQTQKSESQSKPPRERGGGRRGGRDFDRGEGSNFEDVLVKLYRCATVVKGGRRFSFGALTVVGDRKGQVGYGYAKANEVPPSVEKSIKQARRRTIKVPLRGTSIPHRVEGRFGASRVMLIPAGPGTGVIAGSAPRAVLELAGVKDVLTKCYGSTSPKNLIKATIDGLMKLRTRTMIEELRGVRLDLPPEPEIEETVPQTDSYVAPEDDAPQKPAAEAQPVAEASTTDTKAATATAAAPEVTATVPEASAAPADKPVEAAQPEALAASDAPAAPESPASDETKAPE